MRKKTTSGSDLNIDVKPFTSSSTHTIPARHTIIHPKDRSEFVTIICHGWAVRSIMAPDGHRQILSFLLPGDIISAANLFAPMSGHSVDAITEVIYRKFKQSELKAALFERPALLEKLSIIWIDERAQADQLALNISRKSAHKRIAWLILNLAKRLTKTEIIDGQRMDFPLRQHHIAHATGLTHIYVGKVLGEFQRDGLIEISNRSLRIIDKEKLRQAAGW
jgi:CRP-like cAMP-binding protein